MNYRHLTVEERYAISAGRMANHSIRTIAANLGRSPSSISREIRRNSVYDGCYVVVKAQANANGRRKRCRKHSQFGPDVWRDVEKQVKTEWSPEQISLRRNLEGKLSISHQTIYRHLKLDRRKGGHLFNHLRQSGKKRRKRYARPDSRGHLRGKRPLRDRPKEANHRQAYGHFELDLVLGKGGEVCVLTMVDRLTLLTIVRPLRNKTVEEVNRRLFKLIPKYGIKTITCDNGCEFHGFKEVERRTGVNFYFARPGKSWERGTSENTNGLIRQYLEKGTNLDWLDMRYCRFIESRLNNRPRKTRGSYTPNELLLKLARGVALRLDNRPTFSYILSVRCTI